MPKITDKRIDKLPKWAQRLIDNLEDLAIAAPDGCPHDEAYCGPCQCCPDEIEDCSVACGECYILCARHRAANGKV